jgi:hypothetical protein
LRVLWTLVALTCIGMVAAGCSSSPSTSLRGAPKQSASTTTSRPILAHNTPTTSVPLSAASFDLGPCADIATSPLLNPDLDLRSMLLGPADLPAGATISGPHQTTASRGKFAASVPSTSPAAYEDITLYTDTSAGGTSQLLLSEVIGDVTSVNLANQLLAMLDAEISGPHCSPGGSDTISLPGTSPSVSATRSGGQASSGSTQSERLFAAQGSRLLCLTWTSSTANSAAGLSAEPTPQALPDAYEMTQVLNTALNHITS